MRLHVPETKRKIQESQGNKGNRAEQKEAALPALAEQPKSWACRVWLSPLLERRKCCFTTAKRNGRQ